MGPVGDFLNLSKHPLFVQTMGILSICPAMEGSHLPAISMRRQSMSSPVDANRLECDGDDDGNHNDK